MSTAASVVAYVALVWAALLAWLAIGAALRRAALQRRFRARARASVAGRSVLLIRPCSGAEPGLLDNLLSVRTLVTTARLRVIMCVDDADDAAWPIILAAAERLRAAGIDAHAQLLEPLGPNRKAGMLAQLLEQSGEFELIANVDSNVDLDGFSFDALLQPLDNLRVGPRVGARVGATWAPWSERRMHAGLGARTSEAVLGASLTAFPLLCGIYSFGLVGKIWAARREALLDCGFESLPRYLGEDLEMANRLRDRGWGIEVAPVLGRARGHAPRFADVIARFGRWMLATRGSRPQLMITYPLLFFATPMVLALAGVAVLLSPAASSVALGAAVMAVAARLLVTLVAQYWSGRTVAPVRGLLEAVLGDVALALAWLRGMTGREVEWRGRRLRVGSDGQLLDVQGWSNSPR